MKTIRRFGPLLVSAALCCAQTLAAQSLTGFKSASAAAELEAEKTFDSAIDPAEMRSWLQQLSSEPNQVGSPHDKANAEFMLAKFREWGWDARIETFSVLYPTPKEEVLEMVGPVAYKARLAEGPVDGDGTSSKTAGGLPPYNIYCADGDVTADLVYVNFGMPEDYVDLARRGVDVSGKIVITRYGGGWRGLKAKLAQEHGALGCIIYSDPHEDGYWRGDTYPKGGFRPEQGVQRGSVADITQYSGDPLTPGVGSTETAQRLPLSESKVILKIPVLPISYGDAKPLLAALEGPVAPARWRGALPITYHIGPGPAKVHLKVLSDWGQKPIYDVIAFMRGSTYPNQWVLRGNHHDGWVFGAWDPLAGNIAVMAEAKAIGALAKAGWAPKRTLVYASWDGEEAGLLGSTEWAETHADELQRKGVLYVNSDTNARGLVRVEGSHTFQHFANEVEGSVPDPETGATLLERVRATILVQAMERSGGEDDASEVELKAAKSGGDIPIDALGSGSDYTPFLQHLGVASVDVRFGGEDDDSGIYHSDYDSFDHFVRFGDPKFAYGVALARTAGRFVLRVADADLIPQRMTDLSEAVSRYVGEIERNADRERARAREMKELLASGAFRLATDPERAVQAPVAPGAVPPIDFAPLDRAVLRLKRSAAAYDQAFARARDSDFDIASGSMSQANSILQGMEQSLLSRRGLPGRPWYQHMLYAPGLYTGYGAKTVPAVREAVELGHWDEARTYIGVVSATLEAAAARMDQAAALLAPRAAAPQPGPKRAGTPPPDA